MPPTQRNEKLAGFCSAPWTDCITYADGELKACDRNVASFGNWQKDGLKKTWNSEKFQHFRREIAEGRYPDQDCASCHNNGTQRTSLSSMGGAFHMHAEYLKKFLGLPLIPEIEQFGPTMFLRSRTEASDAAFPPFYAFLNQLQEKYPEAFASDREFHNAVVKLRVIAETQEDYLAGEVQPRRVATFRQSQLQAKCTARCVMCAGKFTGEIVDGPTMDEQWVDEAFAEKEDITDFWCNGAEYLYYKGWKKIALMLAEEGTKLRVSTNGILLTEPTIKFMVDNRILRYLTMSLDGATKKTLESTRINVNFDKNMERIRYLLAYAQEKQLEFEFTAAFVMMKRNLEELPAFVRLMHSLRPPGCKVLVTVLCQPLENFDVLNYRRFVHGEHHMLFGEEKLREIFTEAYKAHLETGIQISFYNQKISEFMEQGMPFPRYFPRRSDMDIILADLAREDGRSPFLQEEMERALPALRAAGGGRDALLARLAEKASAIFSANPVAAEIMREFPELKGRIESVLPLWAANFLQRAEAVADAPAAEAPPAPAVEVTTFSSSAENRAAAVVSSATGAMLVEPVPAPGQSALRRLFIAFLGFLYISIHRVKTAIIGNRKSAFLWNLSVSYRRLLALLGLRVNPLPVENHRRGA